MMPPASPPLNARKLPRPSPSFHAQSLGAVNGRATMPGSRPGVHEAEALYRAMRRIDGIIRCGAHAWRRRVPAEQARRAKHRKPGTRDATGAPLLDGGVTSPWDVRQIAVIGAFRVHRELEATVKRG
jgi:hypothetical protein